ncbi:MAG TPA: flagellar motor switch protein [Tenacibaculum sp.]|nr:flagellar motor switch protein [Tenacibaculum sp.]
MTSNTKNTQALKDIELSPVLDTDASGIPLVDKSFELIKNIEIQLSIRIGEATTTVDDLYSYSEGSLVKLDKETNDFVDVLYQGKVVARGELVAIDDNFGVKIQQVFVER